MDALLRSLSARQLLEWGAFYLAEREDEEREIMKAKAASKLHSMPTRF